VSYLLFQSATFRSPPSLYAQLKSAQITFELLVKFTRLLVQTIEELHSLGNEVSNGMMLEVNAFSAFNDFCWCLKQKEVGFIDFICLRTSTNENPDRQRVHFESSLKDRYTKQTQR